MKLSILLICYNQEEYINQCLDSILFQNIPFEFEVIVADDASMDNTLTIVKNKFIGSIQNLKILDHTTNLGISKNYKRAFESCQGEYIAVMEGDDYWTSPQRLLTHVDFLDTHRECVMSMNRYLQFDEQLNTITNSGWSSVGNYKYVTARDMASGNKLGNLSACVFRKSEINKIKSDFYELDIADWMLGLVLSKNGFIAILKELTSVRRVHGNGEWSKMPENKKKESLINCIDSYNAYLEYEYDKEFSILKNEISNSVNSRVSKYSTIGFVPPIIIYLLKLIVPRNFIIYFKDKIAKKR